MDKTDPSTTRPRTRLALVTATGLLFGLLFALPSRAATPSPEQALRLFRAAQSAAALQTAQAALLVESEKIYTLLFSERPGVRELITQPVDPLRLATTPRPPFWWPEARVHWGDYLWGGAVESFTADRPASLSDPEKFRLTDVEQTRARGRDALRLVFESVSQTDRVLVTVDSRTFEPFTIEHELRTPVTAVGARLVEYRLTLSLAVRGGYWLVAQGRESYRFSTPEGDRQVEHSWKSLSWRELTPPVPAAGPS